jgi:4-amino-4-deoxy-L-arabinose transferase-like glycosyltransferase
MKWPKDFISKKAKGTIRYNIIVFVVCCLIFGLYTKHFIYCSRSALPGFDYFFLNSDMNANLKWAQSILDQGPLNPEPYHPYNDWMKPIAPFTTWIAWWGGSAVYQQSPLYAYCLAIFLKLTGNILIIHFIHILCGFLLCITIGYLSKEIFDNRVVGLIAFILSGLYGPFYAYAWPLLRDMLSWLIISLSALLVIRWWQAWEENKYPSARISLYLGVALGMGLLARETYYIIVIIVIMASSVKAFRYSRYLPIIYLLIAFFISISPLIIRNSISGAPLLSTSNRFAETFIEFNASSASGTETMIPIEMKDILERSGGKPSAVIAETIASYGKNYWGLIKKMGKKVLALLDPFESYDNVNLYYMQLISPVVRYGFPHWLIIIPGICGLMLSLKRYHKRHFWLLVFFVCLFANLIIFSSISRYRQSLCIFWIPWMAYYLHSLPNEFSRNRLVAIMLVLLLPIGWLLCIYISPQRLPWTLYRPTEFELSAKIYQAMGDNNRAQAELELYKKLTNDRFK